MPKSRKRSRGPQGHQSAGRERRRATPTYSEKKTYRLLARHDAAQIQFEAPRFLRTLTKSRDQVDQDALLLLMAALARGERFGPSIVFAKEAYQLSAPVAGPAFRAALDHLQQAYGISMATHGHVEAWVLPPRVLRVARLLPMAGLREVLQEQDRWVGGVLRLLKALTALGLDRSGAVNTTYSDLTLMWDSSVSAVLDVETYLLEAGVLTLSLPIGEGAVRWVFAPTVLS